MAKYFGVFRPGLRGAQLRDRIARGTLIRYGRLRLAGDGDSIRTAELIDRDPIARDNSYVKVRAYFVHLPITYTLTCFYCASTTFCRTPTLPIETEQMCRSDKLNMGDYSTFITSNSAKSKSISWLYYYRHCIDMFQATTLSHRTY